MYYKFHDKPDIILPSYIYDDTIEFTDKLIHDGIARIVESSSYDILYSFKQFLIQRLHIIIDMGEVSCFDYAMTLNDNDQKHIVIITDDSDALKATKLLELNAMTLNDFVIYSRDSGNYETKFANDLLKGLSINI